MTDNQVTHILDQIDTNKEDLSSVFITYRDRIHIVSINSAAIELMYALQLLKITSFDGMLDDEVSYIDIKSIDSIILCRKEP